MKNRGSMIVTPTSCKPGQEEGANDRSHHMHMHKQNPPSAANSSAATSAPQTPLSPADSSRPARPSAAACSPRWDSSPAPPAAPQTHTSPYLPRSQLNSSLPLDDTTSSKGVVGASCRERYPQRQPAPQTSSNCAPCAPTVGSYTRATSLPAHSQPAVRRGPSLRFALPCGAGLGSSLC